MSEQLALFRDAIEVCGGCGAPITFTTSDGGRTVDIVHAATPLPCAAFRKFVARLLERRYPSACSGGRTLV